MKDELGDRIKTYYENRTRAYLPRRTYTIVRVDGKSFKTYTKGLNKPFDDGLIDDMNETACYLCKNIQGAKFGFVQSDEISILLTDFDKISTDAWFDGNIQKMVSVAASMATSKFNQLRLFRYMKDRFNEGGVNRIELETAYQYNEWLVELSNLKLAEFDARVFTISSKAEVANCFIWRQQDCVRNSILTVAQSLYGHKEMEGKNTSELQEIIFQKGQNWNDYAPKYKRGRFIFKQEFEIDNDNYLSKPAIRSHWIADECPIFTQDMKFLYDKIPDIE